jgi:CheY-like chemotaxis protein
MPRVDGRELLDHIRHGSAHASIPVLMVTGESNENRLAAVQQSGVSAIRDKPFEPATVPTLVPQMVAEWLHTTLGESRRLRAGRVFGPDVFRVASPHLLPHGVIGTGPETGEIGSHLQRPAGRRQQLQDQRQPPLHQPRSLRQAKHLL